MNPKKVLITGSDGQLGQSLLKLKTKYNDLDLIPADITDFDITDKAEAIKFTELISPDVVVNCAAYTAVDLAEKERDAAFKVNQQGPAILSEICKRLDISLIHISTDYVFSGNSDYPYSETDKTDPLTEYGKSKLAGENEILVSGVKGIIIRTSWLYSEFGHNFFKSMIRLGQEKTDLGVVNDQYGSPTYATDLAHAILSILSSNKGKSFEQIPAGIYHYCNRGTASWFDLADAIMVNSGLNCKILPISTEEFPRPAVRPKYSVLNTDKITDYFSIDIPDWKESLKNCIAEIKKQKR